MAIGFAAPLQDLVERAPEFTGRRWALERIADWLRGDRASALITGDPGTGKSALALRVAGTYARDAAPVGTRVLHAHFCRANDDRTLDPLAFVEALAERAAATVPGFADRLLKSASEPHHVSADVKVKRAEHSTITGVQVDVHLGVASARPAFLRTVRDPLEDLAEGGELPAPLLILVDGLDEALTYGGAEVLPDVLEAVAGTLPRGVRLLMMSRPDPRVLRRLGPAAFDLTDDAPPGVDDVREYAARRLTEYGRLSDHARESLAGRIAEAGSGNFLYARYVLDELLAHPDRLDAPAEIALPDGLQAHYRDYLERELARRDEAWEERYRPLLGLLAVAHGDGLSRRLLIAASGLEEDRADDALRVLAQYLSSSGPDGPFRLYHQSFREFLLESREQRVYPALASRRLVELLLHDRGGRWVPGAEPDTDLACALEHLPAHLVDAVRGASPGRQQTELLEKLTALLTDFSYLEAKTAAVGIASTLADLRVAAALSHDREVEVLVAALDRAAHHLRGWQPAERPTLFTQELYNSARALGVAPARQAALERIQAAGRSALLTNWRTHRQSAGLIRALSAHEHDVFAVALSSDAARGLSGDKRGTVIVWDIATGEPERTMKCGPAVNDVCWLDAQRAAVASDDGSAWIVDVSSGEVLSRLAHPKRVTAVARDRCANTLLTGAGDGHLRSWRFPDEAPVEDEECGIHDVNCLAAAEDVVVVVAGCGGERHLWDPDSGRNLGVLAAQESHISSVAITADARTVVAGDYGGRVHVWDVETRELARAFQFEGEWIHSVALASDGIAVAGLDNGQVELLDLRDGSSRPLSGHALPVFGLATSADGRLALSGSGDHTLMLWDLTIGLGTGRPPRRSPDTGSRSTAPRSRSTAASPFRARRTAASEPGTSRRALSGGR